MGWRNKGFICPMCLNLQSYLILVAHWYQTFIQGCMPHISKLQTTRFVTEHIIWHWQILSSHRWTSLSVCVSYMSSFLRIPGMSILHATIWWPCLPLECWSSAYSGQNCCYQLLQSSLNKITLVLRKHHLWYQWFKIPFLSKSFQHSEG